MSELTDLQWNPRFDTKENQQSQALYTNFIKRLSRIETLKLYQGN